MGENDSTKGDLSDIDQALKAIKDELKTGLDSIRTELKADLKNELSKLKEELSSASPDRERRSPPRDAPPHAFSATDSDEDVAAGKPNGRRTQEFTLKDFSRVEVGGAFDVELIRSDAYGISVSGEEDLLRNLEVSKDGDNLRIRHPRHIGWRAQLTRPKATVSLPLLRELRLSGASKAAVSGFESTEEFRLGMSGACRVGGEIAAGNTVIEMSGASKGTLTGRANDVVIEVSGANQLDLRGFSVHNAAVRMSGASQLTLHMDGKIDARLTGVSHLNLAGKPVMGNIKTSGASTLTQI